MSLPPSVLVLLAARNGHDFIGHQIDSILAQEGVRVSLLVRDDGSSDDTREIVAAIAAADARVRLWPDHRACGSASANFFELIRHAPLAEHDFVALADQDDVWQPTKLARAAGTLAGDGAAGYSAAVRAVWPDGRERLLAQSAHVRRADYLFEGAGQGCSFVISTPLFRRLQALLEAHRALQPAVHFHDWALYALARSIGARWHFDPVPTMSYRQHAGNDTGARSSGAGVLRRVGLIRRGWYRAQVDAIVRLVAAANPADAQAARWLHLAGEGTRAWGSRLARLMFVARDGRRRGVDRLIQVAAVALGYL